MTRNLLPRLRSAPMPANVALGTVGAWSTIANPGELAKIEYKDNEHDEVRSRIQSIPSPWARLLLFKAALDDPGHPARRLVENEILDALEFTWSLNRLPGVTLEYERLDLSQLPSLGDWTGSRRAKDAADALLELVPQGGAGPGQPEVTTLIIALVRGRPVFASSPYTVLFTAEDAATYANGGRFFEAARTGEGRQLRDRPFAFQEYVAQVVLPQLYSPAPDGQGTTWGGLQSRLRPWLMEELERCVVAAPDGATDRVRPAVNPGASDWRGAASRLDLEPVGSQALGGVLLYRQRPGAELATSPLRLRSRRGVQQAPLVLVPEHFRGQYFDGAQRLELPPNFREMSRDSLPGLGLHYPWVSPADDWLTDRLILLSEPIERGNVFGYAGYRWRGAGADPRFSEPHLLLPVVATFFGYFAPEDLDEMLAIDVHPDGRIEVTLSIPVGTDEWITVRRTYDESAIVNEHGPAFSLWPSFQDDRWPTYVLFRRDPTQAIAQQFAVHAYEGHELLLPAGQERRTPLVEISVLAKPPEALELRSTLSTLRGRAEPMGVLLPRYRAPAAPGAETWDVGVDFGTSNTVVSVRGSHSMAPRVFSAVDLALPLTETGEGIRHLIDAYFFPEEIPAEPFGTAVVYHQSLLTYDLEQEPLGLRVNIPFTGDVDGYTSNRVQGDLKWSADRHAHFLSASFLRHVLATVIARAIADGVDPAAMSFHWAYPRAFSPSQLNQLRRHWQGVLRAFEGVGVRADALRPELDESRSVLRHFFNANLIQPAGELKAIVDIGGGTSDIALYGRGRVLALDSVILGGRNLTGSRTQGGALGSGNPFVNAFFAWAREQGLPEENRKTAQTYLDRDQVHLAFTYLIGTRWFQRTGGELFTGHPAFHRFQGLVFYFFGALFYYLGLSLRSLSPEGTDPGLPRTILLAGNGSRYLDWLTDLVHYRDPDNVFTAALGQILGAGAGVDGAALQTIQSSSQPKEEVARGLVARVDPGKLPDQDAKTTPVVGEDVTLNAGPEGEVRTLSSASRFHPQDVIEAQHARELRWAGEQLEIERFHGAFLLAAERLASHGDQWGRMPKSYRQFFAELPRSRIQNLAEGRLQYLAQLEDGFRGSLFILEATVVLEEMRDRFFSAPLDG